MQHVRTYYYLDADGVTVRGPFEVREVRDLQKRGILGVRALVCTAGTEEWLELGSHPDFIVNPPTVSPASPRAPQPQQAQPINGCGFGCLAVIAIFFIGALLAKCSPPAASSTSTTSTTSSYASTLTTKSGYYAAVDEEDLQRITSFAVQIDNAAIARLIESGRAFQLKSGMTVEVMERKSFGSILKIRPRGQTLEVWTYMEAVY